MTETISNILNDKHDNYILPFFWQRGEDEATLREYMKVINEANIKAVCVESRPHPDFCGEKWWQDMDAILDEARKRDMKVWILDDSHFPTGFANGAMENQPLSLARRSICCQKYEVKAGEAFTLSADEVKHPVQRTFSQTEAQINMMTGKGTEAANQLEFTDDDLIAISVVYKDGNREDLTSLVLDDGSFNYVPKADGNIYKMNHTRNRGPHQNYINMIDEKSCRVLIDAVYEKHFEHYADDFGKTIAGFFSDEPELGNGHLYELHHEMGIGFEMDYPWSQELDQNLRQQLGEDFAYELPLIWEQEGDETARARARYAYMDNMTRLVEKNFSFQVGDWCRDHGVQYIGHIIEDNGQHCRTGSTLGHYFRSLFGQDMAGIDDIGGQVYPQGEDDNYEMGTFMVRNGEFYHFMLGKLANSLAALDKKKQGNAMCEIFGNYGWQEGLRLEKYLADHFIVRGVNHFVPHAFSAQPFPDPDCPPHFYAHGHNPEYKAFGHLMLYMNRAIELISGGHHIAPVGVVYHGEAEWTGKSMPAEKVARVLTENQIDFDFIPFDAFGDKSTYNTEISEDGLVINGNSYEALILPYMQFIDETFAADISKLVESGVPVYFVDNKPTGTYNEAKSAGTTEEETAFDQKISAAECIGFDSIMENASRWADINIAPGDKYIRYYHYVKADGVHIYMITNEGTKTYEGQLSFENDRFGNNICGIYAYDPWNDKIYSTNYSDKKLNLQVEPGRSRFLIVARNASEKEALEGKIVEKVIIDKGASEVDMVNDWTRSITDGVSYPEFKEKTCVHLPDDYAKVDPEFSGWLKYESKFIGDESKRYWIEITDAFETVEVYVNDKPMGLQIFAPFIYDISEAVIDGENDIRIEIATTLERATFKIPDRFGRPKDEPKEGTGLVGQVHLYQL
ncbi:MAG: hypothetical protein K6B67_07805 [Lachnospiraceae bacterium]|nr:hypothetical protein [Lachnospiraceae bacterium]